MADDRLTQIQRKRKRLQEELELSRKIGELEDEEAQLLAQTHHQHGNRRTTEVIDLSDEPEQLATPAESRNASAAQFSTTTNQPNIKLERPVSPPVNDSTDNAPARRRPQTHTAALPSAAINRRGTVQHARRPNLNEESTASRDSPTDTTNPTSKEEAAPTPSPLPDSDDDYQSEPEPRRRKNNYLKHMPFADQEAYVTIIKFPDDNTFYELRCYLCGANCRPDKHFFAGLHGFMQHFRFMHYGNKENVTYAKIMEACAYRKLEEDDVKAAERGDLDAYSVPRVIGNKQQQNGYCAAARKR